MFTAIQPRSDSCLRFADVVGLQAAAKGTNFVFSPLSIRAALSLAAAGSNGTTLVEFLSFLGSPSLDDLNTASDRQLASVNLTGAPEDVGGNGSKLTFVNGIWVDQSLTLNPPFQETAASIYDAATRSVDFRYKHIEARREVNAWVQHKTNELIKDLIPSDAVNNLTRVILANALYFKGIWADKFDISRTINAEFHLLNGSKTIVPFMTSREDQFIASFNGFKVLKLQYEPNQAGRKFSMLVFLPDIPHGLSDLIQKAVSDSSFFARHVPWGKIDVGNFMVPKFKISSGFEASEFLRRLGLEIPFREQEADFSEMVLPASNLFIKGVYHKATIEVEEEGTKASAATAVIIQQQQQCLRLPVDFVADHPFMFAIREDETDAVLFFGHVANPVEVDTI